ncbi:MAG: iron donor protein CyaY [Neisseria sp.]|nr:iron donor protein CyaY [Neisseria sp.]
MMTESEFLRVSDRIFAYIEESLEDLDDDFDCYTLGNVLTIEHADGAQIIINRHLANGELWIAAKSGGYHFAPQAGVWYSERDRADFFTVLNRVLSEAAQSEIVVPPFQAA